MDAKRKTASMKAIVTTRYGPPEVLQITEVEKPAPRDSEVMVKVYATTVSSGDCRMRSSHFPLRIWIPTRMMLGLTKPRKPIQGLYLAGEIETVGKDVKRFKKGDRVYARTVDLQFGAYAEYACLPEESVGNSLLSLIPSNITYEERSLFPLAASPRCIFLGKLESEADRMC